MLSNYLRTAWRNLFAHKQISLLNIGGLAIGMTSALLIFLWVSDQVSVDRFHARIDRLYQVWSNDRVNGTIRSLPGTPQIMMPTLKAEFPEIEGVTRVDWTKNLLASNADVKLMSAGNVVDPDFLSMFSFPLLQGDPRTALTEPKSIVVTQTLARKLFGSDNVLGKTITLGQSSRYRITGVLKNLPSNTLFNNIEYFCPFDRVSGNASDWRNISVATFVLLKPEAVASTVNKRIKDIIVRHSGGEAKTEEFLYPLSRLHLYGVFENGKEMPGEIRIVKLFVVIAIFILIIACINFMNLSTARSETRAKEIGVRKVSGASRRGLMIQFMVESLLTAVLSALVSLLLVIIFLPAFNRILLTQEQVPFNSLSFWLEFLGFTFFTGVLAGSYPALVLSSFKPITVLKGRFDHLVTRVTGRRLLVVFQFSVAIIMIISTLIIARQTRYAQQRQAGYDRDRLVNIMIYDDGLRNAFGQIKTQLLSSGVASSVTLAMSPLTDNWSSAISTRWEGKDPSSKAQVNRYAEQGDLVKTTGMHLQAGRDIDLSQYPSDSTACLINASAVALMQFKNPLGQIISDDGVDWHVVGVIDDYIQESPFQPVKPMLIKGPKDWMGVILVKLNGQRAMSRNIADMERIFKTYNPAYPFEYTFTDEDYAQKFMAEQFIGKLSTLFTALIIFISCLGLFGLAAYMAQRRVKEIGVRKVLGASVASIAVLLSRDFVALVGIAILIASPVAWWLMNSWLNNYSYRIPLGWTIFAGSGAIALLIAVLTVSFQSIRAGLASPVKSLRTE